MFQNRFLDGAHSIWCIKLPWFNGNCLIQDNIYFIHKSVVNLYITFELDTWSRDLNTDFTLDNCLFRIVKLTKSVNLDKYGYSGNGIGFEVRSEFSWRGSEWGKNVIFGVDNSFSMYVGNRNKKILILGESPTQRLDGSIKTAEVKCSINFKLLGKGFLPSSHYNENNSFLLVKTIKVCQSKPKVQK